MRYSLLALVLSFIGSAAAVRADDAPEPFGALSGWWGRPGLPVATKDGKDYVSARLRIFADGKKWKLVVDGSPATVYWNPLPPVYDLVVPEGAKEGGLALIVKDSIGDRQIRFEYTIEKNALTIRCKEAVATGPWLGDYDISGKWARPRQAFVK